MAQLEPLDNVHHALECHTREFHEYSLRVIIYSLEFYALHYVYYFKPEVYSSEFYALHYVSTTLVR